ncbi:NfeD family protein [Novilysobacter spongiicola]|uniref:Membrane-bound serine protease (ClpP class) n=1 Tax=Lysobacter spongiicola DSM 21749 TaxID=1122188 RepID=A0A1T4MJG5_9GAMM|nr:nodulation protein NfeD [Lysobacter spongiicola]SJZ67083.1 membrane-bound serine protease (ClpP class) [Lysobacter spongiicola DSM 21749]
MRILLLAIAVLAVAAFPAASQDERTEPSAGGVLVLEIQGGIGPATRDYLKRGLQRATEEGAEAVVLRIDTPGGLDASTRDINQAILASEVPVIAWVGPSGARAASAGTYILYATHLAAMAPATSLGAATPVSMGGGPAGGAPGGSEPRDGRPDPAPADGQAAQGDGDPDRGSSGQGRGGSAMERKVTNDSVSYLRSLAELRGRDTDFAERAVRDAATLTASEALAQGVVEIVATDLQDLLQQADGRRVQLPAGAVELSTRGQPVTTVESGWRFKLLSVLTNPTVAYMLLLAGMYGLLFEGYSPGAIVPGVVGAICLLLALYAMQVLPVNYAGLALVMLGAALMVAEFAMPSFGALGIGGLAALVVGSLILFDTDVPGYGVPGQLLVGISLASGLAFMGVVWVAARARRRPVTTGVDELLDEPAVALDDFTGAGRVRTRGEVWQAYSNVPVARGDILKVRAVDGLVLHVAPLQAAAPHDTPVNGGSR